MQKRIAIGTVFGLLALGCVWYSASEAEPARAHRERARGQGSESELRDRARTVTASLDSAPSSSEDGRTNLVRTLASDLDFGAALRPDRTPDGTSDRAPLLERGRAAVEVPPNNVPEASDDPYAVPQGAELPPDTRERVNGQLVGLEPRYLLPVPEAQRPTSAQLQAWEAEAAEERARAPRPGPPDPNLLAGLLTAIRQVKENPALRLGLIDSYLDEIAGLDDAETAEAMNKLDEARRESAQWAP